MAIKTTHDLTKIYGNKVIAVNGINLSIEQGCTFGLLGPNGAGKTTLLKLLMGLQRPTAGWSELFGSRMTPNAASVRQRIGYLPTNPRFPPNLTPIGYLDLIGQLFGMPAEVRKPRLASLIRAVDLLPAASRPIRGFSTGMTTRLGIAASLINDPELLIWDEPTAGLDPSGRKYTLDLIQELGHSKTMIVSSHILSDIDRVCSHVGVLHDGQIIYSGSVRDLKQTIGRNHVEMEIEGTDENIARFRETLQGIPDVIGHQLRGYWIEVRFRPDASLADPLLGVLRAASESGIGVLSLSSTKAQTEDAFIQLLEADQADGFSRAYNTTQTVGSRLDGAPQG
ncbi:MAG: ABC transporter ATP-binding protein [Armatimonadetes bacterium]|nr:ABC transporter ATP-binding protein [Armatimonadota bacterium]